MLAYIPAPWILWALQVHFGGVAPLLINQSVGQWETDIYPQYGGVGI